MTGKYAIVTGASSGIGRELAIIAARDGYDLLLAADTAGLAEVADVCRGAGSTVETLEVDLATQDGVDQLYAATQGRAVDALFANAGHGLGRAFLDQDFDEIRHVVDTNVTGTIYLIQLVARDMVELGSGRILITGSIAGYMPGSLPGGLQRHQGVHRLVLVRAAQRARGHRRDRHLPDARCDRDRFFERADMLDTKVGTDEKDDPADVARVGYDAMVRGDGDVVAGWKNKLQTAVASVTPSGVLAEQHRKMAEPGTAKTRTAGRE